MRAVLYLALFVAPTLLRAQTATQALELPSSSPEIRSAPQHEKELVATYDSLTDSTHLAVVTHKGKYFLWIQHPRLTWTVAYSGRTPGEPPREVLLVFRTQDPQSPRDNHLIIESASGERLELNSISADSRAGPMVGNLLMNFLIPTAELTQALAGEKMKLSVGGIGVKFNSDHILALRNLLSQAGL
jgi:hypothetical protein